MSEMKTFIVYADKQYTRNHHAVFKIKAKNEKEAEKEVLAQLQCTCLGERLREKNKETEEYESEIGVNAEEIDEFNESAEQFAKAQEECELGWRGDTATKTYGNGTLKMRGIDINFIRMMLDVLQEMHAS